MKIGVIDDTRDHFTDVVWLAGIFRNHAIEFLGRIPRLDDRLRSDGDIFLAIQMPHDFAHDTECVFIVFRQVIGDARGTRMHIAPTKFFGGDDFARRRFYQRRAAKKNCPLIPDDDRFVAHRRHVRAARRA